MFNIYLDKIKTAYRYFRISAIAMIHGGIKQEQLADDKTWFELQLMPQYASLLGLSIPKLPSDDIQRGFTGQSGRNNLREAFLFYKHICSTCKLPLNPKILDFGGGWGRIARFFLRDTSPENIWIADCMSLAIDMLHDTGNPCNIIKTDPLPPIPLINVQPDLIYCFSVFSHLNEEYFLTWINYLLNLLSVDGYLVFTIRGNSFVSYLEQFRKDVDQSYLVRHAKIISESSAYVRTRYSNGEFQYLPTGGGKELTNDFYGEAIIPISYIKEKFGDMLYHYIPKVDGVGQEIIVLKKQKCISNTLL